MIVGAWQPLQRAELDMALYFFVCNPSDFELDSEMPKATKLHRPEKPRFVAFWESEVMV
jgi:hypothetical protein